LLAIFVIWNGFKVLILTKIDFSKPLKNNSFNINKYAIYIKYEKLIGYYFIIPLCVLIGVIGYAIFRAPLFWWVFMSCALLAGILFVIYIYRLYNKNISTIQQNLEELRELEDK
jgi:hypothetical protein